MYFLYFMFASPFSVQSYVYDIYIYILCLLEIIMMSFSVHIHDSLCEERGRGAGQVSGYSFFVSVITIITIIIIMS